MDYITRHEMFLHAAAEGEPIAVDAVTREELYLAKIAGADVTTPEPVTRIEKYLARIAGADTVVPEPVTRVEMYLAAIAGEDVTVPEPVTREEIILAEWAETGGRTEIRTVTGNAPLALPDAVAAAIRSLIQYGKVTQSGTPAPDAPVDLVCNNGTFVLVDDELPKGYQRIAGIKFDGSFHYETGEVLTGDDDVTMTLEDTSTTGQNVFGSYNGTGTGAVNFSLYLYGGGSSSNSYFRYGSQLVRPKFGSDGRTVTFGKSGTAGFATDVTVTPDEFTTEAEAYIGMLPNSSSPAYTGTIAENILVGERLRYIPCVREADGTVCYFEAVKGKIIEPVGTGVPVAGAYDYSHSHAEIRGTAEVLAVGDQTATVEDLLAVGDYADEHDLISGSVTRRCGVLVLDGTESWLYLSLGYLLYTGVLDKDTEAPLNTILCTHYKPGSTATDYGNGNISYNAGSITIRDNTNGNSETAFKAFCAAQYAAGTPVIILYPRGTAEEETVPAQSMATTEGDNEITVTANVTGVPLEASYRAVKESV